MTKIPGKKAEHKIIKPECIDIHGEKNAFKIAINDLEIMYRKILIGYEGSNPHIHLVITVESEEEQKEQAV